MNRTRYKGFSPRHSNDSFCDDTCERGAKMSPSVLHLEFPLLAAIAGQLAQLNIDRQQQDHETLWRQSRSLLAQAFRTIDGNVASA